MRVCGHPLHCATLRLSSIAIVKERGMEEWMTIVAEVCWYVAWMQQPGGAREGGRKGGREGE